LEKFFREHGSGTVIGPTDLKTHVQPDLVRECGTIGKLLANDQGLFPLEATRSGPRIAGNGVRDKGWTSRGVLL